LGQIVIVSLRQQGQTARLHQAVHPSSYRLIAAFL
jgi:hypothetical protein